MKIQILSDLHVDFQQNYGKFTNRCHPRADTLVIAGDVHPHKDGSTWNAVHEKFITTRLLPKWKNVILIPGNHEFYGGNANDEMFGRCMKVYENSDGHKVYYCNNHTIELEGVYFICSTLWSHIGFDRAYHVQHSMNDYRMVKGLTVDMINDIHIKNRQFLSDALQKIPKGKRCIIVTHHIPSFNLISQRWRSNDLNDAFSADMDTFIMMNSDKISYWVHGHSHDYCDQILDGVHFIRNPMGYPREEGGDMDLVVNI